MKKLEFACWYKFIEIKSWLKYIRVGMVINGCAHSGHRTLKLTAYLAKKLMELIGFWFVNVNPGKLKVTLIIRPLSYKGSYKTTFVCLSVRQFGIFLRNHSLLLFSLIYGTMVDIGIFKSWQRLFSRKKVLFYRSFFHFCSNLGKKGPIGQRGNRFLFDFLRNFGISFLWK